MNFPSETAAWPDFPNPAGQARAILETCHDDINDAHVLVTANVKFARTAEDLRFWEKVQMLLLEPRLPLTSASATAKRVPEERASGFEHRRRWNS
jgi:hypothetical protein